jgi:hypothetical protein
MTLNHSALHLETTMGSRLALLNRLVAATSITVIIDELFVGYNHIWMSVAQVLTHAGN